MSYFALFFIAAGMGILDSGLGLLNRLSGELVQDQEQRVLIKQKLLNDKDASIQRRRVTNIACKLYL
jgi:hypothetical protein